ncbi:MAG TPA: YbaK/EbsC family protein [Terriglobia bacterium]|nr:YbaK/EbsC family protein [Terriglobia bacterium]
MTVSQRILDYLDSQGVNYECVPHPQAFAAQEVAQTLHVSGKRFAKPIVLDGDGRLLMAVLPASHRLDLHRLKVELDVQQLEMVAENELAKFCPDCEIGAFPPFGNLYGMDVWVDRALSQSEEIMFNAGSHTEAIRMKYADYARLVMPQVGRFAELLAA